MRPITKSELMSLVHFDAIITAIIAEQTILIHVLRVILQNYKILVVSQIFRPRLMNFMRRGQ